MSKWTHSICAKCYQQREPGREPARAMNAKRETCCFCGNQTHDGIYYRANPDETLYCQHNDNDATGYK